MHFSYIELIGVYLSETKPRKKIRETNAAFKLHTF